jgi:hypothetical protein
MRLDKAPAVGRDRLSHGGPGGAGHTHARSDILGEDNGFRIGGPLVG